MSDDARDEKQQPEQPHTGLVHQPHGGAIAPGRPGRRALARIPRPTVADVAAAAAEWLYKILPRINAVASNRGKKDKATGKFKRPYKIADQMRAGNLLAKLAILDRTLREVRVSAALSATRDEIIEFFDGDRERAEALMAKIAPHWLGI